MNQIINHTLGKAYLQEFLTVKRMSAGKLQLARKIREEAKVLIEKGEFLYHPFTNLLSTLFDYCNMILDSWKDSNVNSCFVFGIPIEAFGGEAGAIMQKWEDSGYLFAEELHKNNSRRGLSSR